MASKKQRKMKKDLSRARRKQRQDFVRNNGKRLFKRYVKDTYGGLHIASSYVDNQEAVDEAQRRLDLITRRLRITNTITFDRVSERDLLTVLDGTLEKSVENGLVKFVQQGFVIAKDRGEGVRKFLNVEIFDQAQTLTQVVTLVNQVASKLKGVHTKGRQTAYQIVWYTKYAEGTLY